MKIKPIIGVLAIQGSVIEHLNALKKCGAKTIQVRNAEDLKELHGLIIPGGESTTISKLMQRFKLDTAIIKAAKNGMGVYGTCAGAIIVSRSVNNDTIVQNLNIMDLEIDRNYYGPQIDSFHATLEIPILKEKQFPAIFIRAPRLIKTGKNVEILAKLGNDVVLARQHRFLVSTFHPELTNDLRIHKYFIRLCENKVTTLSGLPAVVGRP